MEVKHMPMIPMLRTLHMFPKMMDVMVADKGAIKHIFSGSHVMAPGLTSEAGFICPDLPANAAIALHVEGKQHAIGVGVLSMSSEDIEEIKKGEAI